MDVPPPHHLPPPQDHMAAAVIAAEAMRGGEQGQQHVVMDPKINPVPNVGMIPTAQEPVSDGAPANVVGTNAHISDALVQPESAPQNPNESAKKADTPIGSNCEEVIENPQPAIQSSVEKQLEASSEANAPPTGVMPHQAVVKQEIFENGEDKDPAASTENESLPVIPDTCFNDDAIIAAVHNKMTEMDLTGIQVENWLMIQKRRFDVKVFDEPFHGIRLLFNLENGQYIHRVWGKTRSKGKVTSTQELVDLCVKFFHRVVPCLGFFDFRDGFSMSRDDLIAVEFPIPRVISKDCLFSYALSEGDGGDSSPTVPELLGIGLCSMCLGVSKAAAKQEPSSDGEVEDEDIAAAEEFMQMMDDDMFDNNTVDDDEDDEDYDYKRDLKGDFDFDPVEKKVVRRRVGGRPQGRPGVSGSSTGAASVDAVVRDPTRRQIVHKEGRKRYKCPECAKEFNQPRSLDKHREIHHMYGTFHCPICPEGFYVRFANEFYKHFTAKHPDRTFRCSSCNEAPFGPNMEQEYVAHYVKCNKMRERLIRKERRSSQGPTTKKKPHQCEECGKTFAARTTFQEHKNWHKGIKPIKCPDCDFETCFSTSLYTHSKIHMRERGLEKMNNEILLVFTCELCGNRYNQANQLRTHIKRKHEGVVEERECNICGQVFTNRQNLRRHQARTHPKDPSLQCKICGHVCADRYAFNLHTRVHREPDFMCRFCGKAVKSKQTLQAHERSHTGENPYICDQCDYACKSSSVLNRHKQAKHNMQPGPPRASR